MKDIFQNIDNYKIIPHIYNLQEYQDNNIYIMRDDLIPFSFGGNKVRKAYNFFDEILKNKNNYVITYGSASSNHCRIIANLCKKCNIPCTIITTDKDNKTNNKILCELFGVEFVYCNVNKVKNIIDQQINTKEKLGYKPYFIPGGGHGNLGTKAYVDAYKEILEYEEKNNMRFDYIFHASGTGTTQAGLVLGKIINDSKAKIIGISIARKLPQGRDIVIDSIKNYIKEYKVNKKFNEDEVIFIDDYVLDGYGKYNKEIRDEIKNIMCQYGIHMDTTYVGKAYWGMKKYIKSIRNKNILFIHTGGTPIFFDNLKELK